MTEKRRVKALQNLGIITLILIALYYANELFNDQISTLFTAVNAIVFPLAVALFISYLIAPLIKILQEKAKIKNRVLAMVIVLTIVTIVTGIFLFFIGDLIYTQAALFIANDWENIRNTVQNYITNNERFNQLFDQINNYVTFETVSPQLINIFNLFRSTLSILVSIVLIPVFLVFLLMDKQAIFEGIISVLPDKYIPHVRELGVRANHVIEKYFNGRFISMFTMSVFFTIVFFILGFKERSIFFGFTLGFLDIIPYIGSFIGLLLPVLYSFTIPNELMFGSYSYLAIIAINLVGQFLQNNVLQPWIMGKEVQLHPLLVLTSFIFFGALFGITGVIIAIPITGTIKTSYNYFSELNQETKETLKKT